MQAEGFQKDAIVQLRLNDAAEGLKKEITSNRLREILPDSMNIQYGLEFYKSTSATK